MTAIDATVAPSRTEIMTERGTQVAAVSERHSAGARRRLWFAPESPVPIIAGVVLTLAGFGLIALAWSKVAGLAQVALQVPYIVSAGFTGIALVLVGLVLISTSVRRQDTAARERQMAQLRSVLLDAREERDDT